MRFFFQFIQQNVRIQGKTKGTADAFAGCKAEIAIGNHERRTEFAANSNLLVT
jgi:hypothetical protein